MKKIARKFNFYHAAFVLLLVSTSFFAACQIKSTETRPEISSPTRSITDDLGRSLKIPANGVERAVSLAPNLTEIAFAIGAGDRLVGVTTFCDYPVEAQKIRKIGDTINPNIETIIALQPQVVFVSTASQIENFTSQLDAQNIAVFVTNPNSLDDIYKSVLNIGDVFGKREEANRVVENLRARVGAVERRTRGAKPVKVFVQISKESLYTVGKDSFITDLIARAGGESLTANLSTAYPNLSKETATALAPEAIILSASDDNREPNDAFKASPAMRNGKVYAIDAALVSRPAPRIVDGLEQIAKALHPEVFN